MIRTKRNRRKLPRKLPRKLKIQPGGLHFCHLWGFLDQVYTVIRQLDQGYVFIRLFWFFCLSFLDFTVIFYSFVYWFNQSFTDLFYFKFLVIIFIAVFLFLFIMFFYYFFVKVFIFIIIHLVINYYFLIY